MSKAGQLPHDINVEILSKLPVKSIYRFKRVCKRWLSLFSERKFISLHRKNTLVNPKNYSLLVDQFYNITHFNFNFMEKPLKLYTPKCYEFVGICNGIVCFTTGRFGTIINLYNPAAKLYKYVRFHRVLDDPDMIYQMPRVYLGFGLGLNEDEFIIVRIQFLEKGLHRPEEQVEVHVYSTVSDSWKKIEVGFKFKTGSHCLLIKGIPHWEAFVQGLEEDKDKYSRVLLWYDVENEVLEFKHLRLPKLSFADNKNLCTRFVLSELEDNLALLVYSTSGRIDAWTFDHNGECFSKKFSVNPVMFDTGSAVGCLTSGEISFVKKGTSDLFLFDPLTKENKYIYTDTGDPINRHRDFWISGVYSYTESLISIDGMKQLEDVI